MMKLIKASDFAGYEKSESPAMDFRRKERERVSYFKSGNIKSVYLNEQIAVQTAYGKLPAELLTFYESGALKRLFPRYGAISAYWGEKDEARITEVVSLNVGGNQYKCRPQCLHFYESGSLMSITIYNHDTLVVPTAYGDINTNIGVSFYENGRIESIEPAMNTEIELEHKRIRPFNFFADGMHADHNSLVFNQAGEIIDYSK